MKTITNMFLCSPSIPHPGNSDQGFLKSLLYFLGIHRDLALGRNPEAPHPLDQRAVVCSFHSSQMVSVVKDLCSEHTGQEQRPMGVNIQALQVASSEC